MKRLTPAFIVLLLGSSFSEQRNRPYLQWLIEDALEEERLVLELPDITGPSELKEAVDSYGKGDYQLAATNLQKLVSLNLPDGRSDFLTLMLGECYRAMGLRNDAVARYRHVADRFAGTPSAAPACLRLLEHAYWDRNTDLADSLYIRFRASHQRHPLYNSARYVVGKVYFRTGRYGEAGSVLQEIPQNSIRHFQAQYLAALCYIELEKTEKALLLLGYVQREALDEALVADANVTIGDIYFSLEKYKAALRYYTAVSKDASWYSYAQVRIARIHLFQEEYQKARDIAKALVGKGRKSDYFFEIALILEQAYVALGDDARADRTRGQVLRENTCTRVSFDVREELTRVCDMKGRWRRVEYAALERMDADLVRGAQRSLGKLYVMERKLKAFLRELGAVSPGEEEREEVALAGQRYIGLLRRQMSATNDSLRRSRARLQRLTVRIAADSTDSVAYVQRAVVEWMVDSLGSARRAEQHEFVALRRFFQQEGAAGGPGSGMQAKYIDWSFMRYLENKALLRQPVAAGGQAPQQDSDSASLSRSVAQVASLFTAIDRDKLMELVSDDRARLIQHIELQLETGAGSRFQPQILFRLAELYYDEASDDFARRLGAYEVEMEGDSEAELDFPEYDLTNTMGAYDRILARYSKHWLADDAAFYKALALKKMGADLEAKKQLLMLTVGYPESEYYVEANMEIGRYYFEHPGTAQGKGYQKAEEAYRRVLQYRDHPQFVQALYHLGWCYYMQDRYEDAISVFKYLVEEVELDFDWARAEQNQVLNPLMRDEAIDYIAISFDEQGDISKAIKFLTLVGNEDYAARVLKRIGELREEDIDYAAAAKVYERLLKEYPGSGTAPDAVVSLVKVLETSEQQGSAMREREQFFDRFGRGSPWHNGMEARDTARVMEVDSMAISMALYVGDDLYRRAEKTGNRKLYERAAEEYEQLVAAYADDVRALEAAWNLAVILDKKLGVKKKAYGTYLKYSRADSADVKRREQGALNAVAIAQSLLPGDSVQESGKVGVVRLKVIESCRNYIELFPEGGSVPEVVMSMGAVYFNQKMFANARETYGMLTAKWDGTPACWDARFLVGQCYFGEENWIEAAAVFSEVREGCPLAEKRQEAFKLLLQSHFLYGKQLYDSEAYEEAAQAFRRIESAYPGSEYGDIVLFKAAEACEKREDWLAACQSYHDLYVRYPQSKLVPGGLFNAAADYEKGGEYGKAAEVYETLVSKFPKCDRARDALFNVGLCYEKIGRLDMLADANERFARMFPGEKDVQLILMRSGQFYYRSRMYEKAQNVYRSFVRRYPKSPCSIEAYHMLGKCLLALDDRNNALAMFSQAETQNKILAGSGLQTNTYYAAESAYQIGMMKQERCDRMSLAVPQTRVKEIQENKTAQLADAVAAYQRVMRYKSERMFEAGFRIGRMYEEFADSWAGQKLVERDPIRKAVAKKDLALGAAALLEKSFGPYAKVIELAGGLDSIGQEQADWVGRSKDHLAAVHLASGRQMESAVAAMMDAPVPREIRSQPLYLFQYRKQLLETVAPMKANVRDRYLASYRALKDISTLQSASDTCFQAFGRLAFEIPNAYDKMADLVLYASEELPEEMGEEDREELVFQLEDIVFELQDSALFGYENALESAKQENLSGTRWYGAIIGALARLSPETYGTKLYAAWRLTTGKDWLVRVDSAAGWNSLSPSDSGWQRATLVSGRSPASLGPTQAPFIWTGENDSCAYFWRHVFVQGEPREGTLYYSCPGAHQIYLNGSLLVSDTSAGGGVADEVDSMTGIVSLLKGGDNCVALKVVVAGEADSGMVSSGIALSLSLLVDTALSFDSSVKLPGAAMVAHAGAASDVEAPPTADTVTQAATPGPRDLLAQYKNRGELASAIVEYQERVKSLQADMRRERLEVQKLRVKHQTFNERIGRVKTEIEEIRKMRAGMTRER